jgi:acyl dehydratase
MGKFDHLIGMEIENGYCSWDSDKALLYAVGVGAGLQNNLEELQFTTENSPGITQHVLPTFMVLMSAGGNWIPLLGFASDAQKPLGMVHGEQAITLAQNIPTQGRAHVSRQLKGVYDKGSGALVVTETRVTLESGQFLGSTRMALFIQGQGGFGGTRTPLDEQPWSRPEHAPDVTVSLPVGMNQSLIYRLLGDRTLHGTDPAGARADGFERPIFFGLGTFGVAGRAILRGLCDNDISRFGTISGRFSKPVYPGEQLEALIWHTDGGAVFQMVANGERISFDRGVFRYRKV